ncbi:DUF4910 domain-containing protein [Gemmatimonadota bacterium]
MSRHLSSPTGYLRAMLPVLFLLCPAFASAQTASGERLLAAALPLTSGEAEALASELSGEIALHHVRELAQHHRIQASPMMHEAAVYVRDRLIAYGLEDAEIHSYPSDGRRAYQTWLSPVGWTIEEAELWMVAPRRLRLARFTEIANSLVTLSASADEEGILVDAGTGLEEAFYDSVDVRGRIVLASGYGGNVHRLAVLRHGAVGVVCWNDNPDHPDQVRYTGMWPKAGERERIRWGFNVSYRTGQMLKQMLTENEDVRLHAEVLEGNLQDGALDVVSATIPGARFTDGEILLLAHLDHPKPSANDNASGSAAMLEIARALRRLIDDGTLPPPDRTIRFLWVAEMYGTAAWLDEHSDVGERTAFAINLDMVGTPAEISVLQVIRSPSSASSILDQVIGEAARWVAGLDLHEPRGGSSPLNYRVTPYSGGSDHYMLSDGAVGVPAVMLNTWPDPYYHSSEDTPDKIDPTMLKRSGLIGGAAAWALATMRPDEADGILQAQVVDAVGRLEVDQQLVVGYLEGLNAAMEDMEIALMVVDADAMLEAQVDREMRAASTILRLLPTAADSLTRIGYQRAVTRAQARLEAHGSVAHDRVMQVDLNRIAFQRDMIPLPQLLPIASIPERDAARGLVYRRTTRGPITDDWFLDHLPAERRAFYEDGEGGALMGDATLRYEIVNHVDGSRHALDIRNAVSASYGFQPLDRIVTYLSDLEAAGLLVRTGTGNGLNQRRP